MSDTPSIHGDTLAADLSKMIDDSIIARGKNSGLPAIDKPKLMESLVMYIVRRDHKIHDAGIETGRALEKGDLEPEEED